MNLFKISAISIFAVIFSSSAYAQNSQLSAGVSVIDSVTSEWAVTLLTEIGFSVEILEQTETADHLQVTAPSGGVFYMALRACNDSAPRQCSLIQPYAFFNATGVTYADMNELLRNKFAVSHAFLSPNNKGTIASKIILAGGVTKGNIVVELARYFYDLDNLFESIRTGTKAEVNFEPMNQISGINTSKIRNSQTANDDLIINAVGQNAPKFLLQDLKALID